MNFARGILLIAAGVFAIYAGWHQYVKHQPPWLAFGLAAVAIALGVWRITRKR